MIEPSSVDCVIYHADCTDGFGSAYSAWKLLGNRAEYYACKHGTPPPDVKGKNVVILDFAFNNPTTKKMIEDANTSAEKNIIKSNEVFHKQMEIRKKNTEEKIKQLKNQAIKDLKSVAINIAFESIEKLMLNSLDKSKLDKIYNQSIEETKLALQKKSS